MVVSLMPLTMISFAYIFVKKGLDNDYYYSVMVPMLIGWDLHGYKPMDTNDAILACHST